MCGRMGGRRTKRDVKTLFWGRPKWYQNVTNQMNETANFVEKTVKTLLKRKRSAPMVVLCFSGQKMAPTRQSLLSNETLGARMMIMWEE